MVRVGLVGLIAGGTSGVPRYTAALAAALDEVSAEFPELSLRLLTTRPGLEAARVRNLAVELLGPPGREPRGGPRRIMIEQRAARAAADDLLHFFDLTGPMLAPRRRFTATVHDAAIRHGYETLRMAHKRVLQPWAIRHAARVVAVSQFARAEAVQRFGAPPERVTVIHSGPGLGAAAPDATQAGSPPVAMPPPPYLLYVGNLAIHKNLLFLIEAFEAAGGELRLVLAGSWGARSDEIQAAIARSRARERIVLRRGASDAEIDHLYRHADALLLPSRYEGFGFTALEAMARGCPVAASDIPALREIAGDGAWLLPLDDREAWASAMRRLSGEAELRSTLRDRGIRRVAQFSWTETARGLCRLFLEVASAAAPSHPALMAAPAR